MSDENKILNVVLILLIAVGIFLFNNKLSDKKNLERENLTLKEERKELDNKINELDAKILRLPTFEFAVNALTISISINDSIP